MPDRERREKWAVVWDGVMLVLILANLALILFDWLFAAGFVQSGLQAISPSFYRFYAERVHAHFLWYDLAFITVFVADLLVRWVAAIVHRRYHRWFFFPFVHWYDVLGCIPVSSLRALRILRVFTMLRKMQALHMVDLRDTYLYGKIQKYAEILTEEISDRVVVNILEGIQEEMRGGGHVTERIARDVVEPRRRALVASLSERLQQATHETYELYQEDVQRYVHRLIADAVERNREIKTIQQMPMVGRTISRLLEEAIADIVFNVVNDLMEDLAASENNPVVAHVTEMSADAILAVEDEQLNDVTVEIVSESLEIIKEQVRIQQWKKREERDREEERLAHDVVQTT
jgi:hypothetical protein